MQIASACFDDAQKDRIREAVAAAELHTSAELLPVVATASGRYDRAEDIVGLWSGGAVAAAVWVLFQNAPGAESGDWGSTWPGWELVSILAGLIAGFLVGAVLASRVGWLRLLFCPRTEMEAEVQMRARALFFDERVHHTAGGTGLLIYVSLFERMASVVADETVLEKLGQSTLDALCKELTGGLREGHPTDALCAVISTAAQKLGPVLPRADDDVNELSDALVTIDAI